MPTRTLSSQMSFRPANIAVCVLATVLRDVSLLSAFVAAGGPHWHSGCRVEVCRPSRPLNVEAKSTHVLGVESGDGVLSVLFIWVFDEGVAAFVAHGAGAEALKFCL